MTEPSQPLRKFLFAPAAGPGVGGGHVMRCLTLAEALKARGADCVFAVNDTSASLMERYGGRAVKIHRGPISSALQTEAFDTLVVDDYAVSADQERPFRDQVRSLAVIDDLADRQHVADLLIDPGYGRKISDYDGLLPANAKRLVGPAYALVKPAFTARRSEALSRPMVPEPQRLFVSFGLSDIDGIAERAIRLTRYRHIDVRIDIALASDAQSGPQLKARIESDPNLHLHFDADNVAELMAAADLAIGAGGASTWERCCHGLPTLAVVVADNQRAMIRTMAADGLLVSTDLQDPDFEAAFAQGLAQLWRPETRAALRTASAALCDGKGANRIAETILAL